MGVFLGFLPVFAFAQQKTSPDLAKKNDGSFVQSIERQKQTSNQVLQKKIEAIERSYKRKQVFEGAQKQKKIDFELIMTNENDLFLDSLKTMSPEERKPARLRDQRERQEKYKVFNQSLQDERDKFYETERQLSLKEQAEIQKLWKQRPPAGGSADAPVWRPAGTRGNPANKRGKTIKKNPKGNP